MFFIDYLLLFGINLDGTISTKLGQGEYGGENTQIILKCILVQ